ncbi:MAG: ATP-grasp domain-containing protein [Myxococcaceae bacterium]|nr:ATP-grasp domain-containing protein [Myxococcaceae bacterium]
MRNVIFAAPFPSYDVLRFVRAVSRLGDVRLLGVFGRLNDEVRATCDDAALVDDATDVEDLCEAVRLLTKKHGRAHRVVGINEVLMVQLAQVRERFDVPGTPVKTAVLFREKAAMKDALRAAGLPVARHALVRSGREAEAFADSCGLPLVVKPPAGVGAKSTFRARTGDELREVLERMPPAHDRPVLLEELLVGTEHSFETLTVGGVPRAFSFSDYLPGCLEVLEHPWMQWVCRLPREVDRPAYERAKRAGIAAIRALGLDDGVTHMEWFARPDGSIAIGEIAQRPPGPQLCQMTGVVNDVDIYRAWARAVIDGALDAPWNRRFAAATAWLRGVGRGRVSGVSGLREAHALLGAHLVEARLPTIGARKNDGYEGDGYVVLRHERTETVTALIRAAIETLRVHYDGEG